MANFTQLCTQHTELWSKLLSVPDECHESWKQLLAPGHILYQPLRESIANHITYMLGNRQAIKGKQNEQNEQN
jgi:hypothetical protein